MFFRLDQITKRFNSSDKKVGVQFMGFHASVFKIRLKRLELLEKALRDNGFDDVLLDHFVDLVSDIFNGQVTDDGQAELNQIGFLGEGLEVCGRWWDESVLDDGNGVICEESQVTDCPWLKTL